MVSCQAKVVSSPQARLDSKATKPVRTIWHQLERNAEIRLRGLCVGHYVDGRATRRKEPSVITDLTAGIPRLTAGFVGLLPA